MEKKRYCLWVEIHNGGRLHSCVTIKCIAQSKEKQNRIPYSGWVFTTVLFSAEVPPSLEKPILKLAALLDTYKLENERSPRFDCIAIRIKKTIPTTMHTKNKLRKPKMARSRGDRLLLPVCKETKADSTSGTKTSCLHKQQFEYNKQTIIFHPPLQAPGVQPWHISARNAPNPTRKNTFPSLLFRSFLHDSWSISPSFPHSLVAGRSELRDTY